jgi:hypothetical protein
MPAILILSANKNTGRFGVFGCNLLLVYLAYGTLVMNNNEKENISTEEAQEQYGVSTWHQRMPNGERRFRLRNTDGSGYIRTESTPESGWQNSHFHKNLLETYIVQSGWMVLVSLREDLLIFEKLLPGEVVTTLVNEPHNVYLPADAVIHTVKHGDTKERDWWPSPELDEHTKKLSEEELVALVGD